ncbi:hypothetical protein GLE_0967 [Lysobacter enzymogenes]|uniref:Uncharacterized protein n=1 Tax=Lysobacter enzymogenes TaxID=69 RepID=A0A0S2DCR2_LYSEN|nr:hypothetical protein GLE_0967 [Lysobacter enzymogenes]
MRNHVSSHRSRNRAGPSWPAPRAAPANVSGRLVQAQRARRAWAGRASC